MPKEDRIELLLQFLAEYDIALPLRPIYYNLEQEYRITVTQETIGVYLDELVSDGLVERIDQGNGYYRISSKGRRVADNAD